MQTNRYRWTPILTLLAFLALPLAAFADGTIVFKDPKGDDNGPGKYQYPTKGDYQKGDFDLTHVKITDKGSNVEFRITVRNRLRDVWNSRSWGGNGFSVQFAQVYIKTGKGGHTHALPGMNVQFAKGHRWNKVVLLSPQGATRLKSEINLKARKYKDSIVIPTSTSASGKTIIAIVPKSALGGFSTAWGFQVLLQSNEGFPRKTDLLTRPVNEYNGEHRFGGGHDGDCDPHVIDMLAGKARGDGSEKAQQHKQLSTFSCEGKGKHAAIQMVYAK
jgi:carbohydrate-binding DOMON domain-containing protein